MMTLKLINVQTVNSSLMKTKGGTSMIRLVVNGKLYERICEDEAHEICVNILGSNIPISVREELNKDYWNYSDRKNSIESRKITKPNSDNVKIGISKIKLINDLSSSGWNYNQIHAILMACIESEHIIPLE